MGVNKAKDAMKLCSDSTMIGATENVHCNTKRNTKEIQDLCNMDLHVQLLFNTDQG